MIAKIQSCGLTGLDGYIVDVEADASMGFPAFEVVGLPDTAVRESRERVRSAVKNSGFTVPAKRIIINLAPADRKKEGPAYDLATAIALLCATEQIQSPDTDGCIFLGELSLDGRLRAVNGALPMAVCAKNAGIGKIILPAANAREAALVGGPEVYGADSLYDVIKHIRGSERLEACAVDTDGIFKNAGCCFPDFADVKGQDNVKRALEVAVAGGHNILMIGAPGSGKSMLAQRIPGILPDMTFDEAIETTKIHSVAGTLPEGVPLMTGRPFRSPHHTVSAVGISGGGSIPKPGEISLAHNGVLFLDELPEFRRDALEVLRQPLEEGRVTISRVGGTVTYPGRVMLAASMNPCKCGYYGDTARECTCTPPQISKYIGKISGPLLDRIDIHVEVSSVEYSDLERTDGAESSGVIKKRIDAARRIQVERYREDGIYTNAQLSSRDLKRYCMLGAGERALLRAAFDNLGLSARAHDRILKVSRTIADLEGSERISQSHIAEAVQYRSLDRKYWHM